MFCEIEKALRSLLADKQLDYSDSYFPNGNLYYIEKDARRGCMTIKFSLLSAPDFESLVKAVKRTISDYPRH